LHMNNEFTVKLLVHSGWLNIQSQRQRAENFTMLSLL
jgi:hypothetical protein